MLSDETLLARAKATDNKAAYLAFDALVRRHQGMVRGMLLNLTRHKPSAEDLSQQTFINAWEKLHQCHTGNFKSWLGSIAYRQFLIWRRSQKRTVKLHNEDWRTTDQEQEHEQHQEQNQTQTPDTTDLHKALGKLPENQRQILVLTALVGMTQQEVADFLKMPLGTVKSHASRGLASLKNLLGGVQDVP